MQPHDHGPGIAVDVEHICERLQLRMDVSGPIRQAVADSLTGDTLGASTVGVEGGESAALFADPSLRFTGARSTDPSGTVVAADERASFAACRASRGIVAEPRVAGAADVAHEQPRVDRPDPSALDTLTSWSGLGLSFRRAAFRPEPV